MKVDLKAGIVFAAVALSNQGLCFEDTAVLPKGVRALNLRTVNTNLVEQTDGTGGRQFLAQHLERDLTFQKAASDETAARRKELEGFLLNHGFTPQDAVGSFSADLRGGMTVVAPVFSYGATDKLTIAVGVPYHRAYTSIDVGFTPNDTAQRFLNELSKPQNNEVESARQSADKLNNAVMHLNNKLEDHGFRSLKDWQAQGLGDMTVAAKYRFLQTSNVLAASTGGVVAPTGRTDDPDIVNDVPFGDGQWDVFGQIAFDEPLNGGVVLNQYAKYTMQLPGRKNVRYVTEDEVIEVDKGSARFKLGDKFDIGTSLQWKPAFGLVSGIGYSYQRKFGDVYRDVPYESKRELEADTHEEAHVGEVMLGYSTVTAFQRGEFAVPFEVKLGYAKQLASVNMPVTDLAQFDMSLFF